MKRRRGSRKLSARVTEAAARAKRTLLGRKTAAASSLRINPLYNPLGTLLRSQINPAGV